MPVAQPSDSEKHKDYFEGKLQLRPADKEVVAYVINQFKKSKTCWIPKTKELKTGVDIYSSSWRFVLAVGKKLKRVFGGTVVTSRELFSVHKMTSKKLYRVTVCYRLPEKE